MFSENPGSSESGKTLHEIAFCCQMPRDRLAGESQCGGIAGQRSTPTPGLPPINRREPSLPPSTWGGGNAAQQVTGTRRGIGPKIQGEGSGAKSNNSAPIESPRISAAVAAASWRWSVNVNSVLPLPVMRTILPIFRSICRLSSPNSG